MPAPIQIAMAIIIKFSVSEMKPSGTLLSPPAQAHFSSRLDATDDRDRARALARERLVALDAKIAELEVARSSLRRLAEACSATTPGPCPIIASFQS